MMPEIVESTNPLKWALLMTSGLSFVKARSNSPKGRWVRTILSRTQGKTWDTIPETKTSDGYVQIWISPMRNGRSKHRKYWIYEPDLGRTARVRLYEPAPIPGNDTEAIS